MTILLAGLSALGPFSIDTYLPSFQDIGASLNATPLEVQQTLTAYMLPFALMSLWHGAIADALGRRRLGEDTRQWRQLVEAMDAVLAAQPGSLRA